MKAQFNAIRNTLCKFSGEDFAIIRECSGRIQIYYALIGIFVLGILFFCFFSAFSFTEFIFHNQILDILIGLVWGCVVTNLYVLLLYTITPILLPKKERKKGISIKSIEFNSSLLFRIGLVVLLATITAQPLNIYILLPSTMALAHDIRGLLANNIFAWVITIFVILVFLLPIYLKYSIRRLGEFYEKKAEIKKRIIEENYKDFKKDYKRILEQKNLSYNLRTWESLMPFLSQLEKLNEDSYRRHYIDICNELNDEKFEKYEYWSNPPFRTLNKALLRKYYSEHELLNHIYSNRD